MLTVQQYKEKYQSGLDSFAGHLYPGVRLITEGYLLFDQETACCWGGPFEGNYAMFVLRDYTNETILGGPNKGKLALPQRALDRRDRFETEVRRTKFLGAPTPEWTDDPIGEETGYASINFPIRLWMFGNDDTSYSKCYRTEQEALDELNLFANNEPLNFHDLVEGFGFVFTN